MLADMRTPRILSYMAMRQDRPNGGNSSDTRLSDTRAHEGTPADFVLEKSIFSNIFEKDIRRVFIYKKAERLAKAIQMVSPAFMETVSLRNRIDAIAIGLIDAAVRPPAAARSALSRELLALSSVLAIAQAGGLLSTMNAELISREAQTLLQEVAAYEEPRLFLDEAPTIASIARNVPHDNPRRESRASASRGAELRRQAASIVPRAASLLDMSDTEIKGQQHDRGGDRREAVLSVIKEKGEASIKDISTRFRDVSEKTIQRELAALVQSGVVGKRGERRWSVYFVS